MFVIIEFISRSLKKMAVNRFINDKLDANTKKLSTIASKMTGNQIISMFSFAGKYESGTVLQMTYHM